jgi:hypothetical protein
MIIFLLVLAFISALMSEDSVDMRCTRLYIIFSDFCVIMAVVAHVMGKG